MISPSAHASEAWWRPQLGTMGYVFCLLFSLTAPILAGGWRVPAAGILALTLAVVFYPQGFRALASRRLWVFLGILVISMTFLASPRDWNLGGIALSRQGLGLGLQMLLRALSIVVAVAGFAAKVSVSEMAGLLERSGLKGLGFAAGVAFNMLPIVRTTTMNAYHAIRLRGGFRRQRLKTLGFLLVTAITNSLRQADDIVIAAEARGFSTHRIRPLPITSTRNDAALAVLLLATTILLA